MSPERKLERRPATRKGLAGPLLFVLRVLAVVLTVQVSNVGHVAADLAGAAFGYTVEHEDCTRDCPDDQCPPGCPNCHCSHGSGGALLPVAMTLEIQSPNDGSSWSPRHAMDRPPSPALSSVYRPPKTTYPLI